VQNHRPRFPQCSCRNTYAIYRRSLVCSPTVHILHAPRLPRTDCMKCSCRNIPPSSQWAPTPTLVSPPDQFTNLRQCSCRNTLQSSRRAAGGGPTRVQSRPDMRAGLNQMLHETAQIMFPQKHPPLGGETSGRHSSRSPRCVPAGTLLRFCNSIARFASEMFQREHWTCFAHNSLVCTAILHCI